jgi:hypothetical protein
MATIFHYQTELTFRKNYQRRTQIEAVKSKHRILLTNCLAPSIADLVMKQQTVQSINSIL